MYTQLHNSCSKHGQLPLLGKSHTHFPVLSPAPTRSILKPPSLPTPKSMHRTWGHSHSLRHTVTGPGSHKPGNSPKGSLQKKKGTEVQKGTEYTKVKFIISFINILCYKNIFGKITLIASFFVFYYTLKELFTTIHRGEGRGEEEHRKHWES